MITPELSALGRDWCADRLDELRTEIVRQSPVKFCETYRYLPAGVTRFPGYIRFDLNPYAREIVECADVRSDVREVNLKKGVQITYTTMLESILFYFICHIKTRPLSYVTADKELASERVENNILPMLQQSGFGDVIRSSDEGNNQKTGKTKSHIQFEGGGFFIPQGAINAAKMRQFSYLAMLKDELDAWPERVGKDGDPDALTDARTDGFEEERKIFRGSTPLVKGTSKIEAQYQRGDCREYHVPCLECGELQPLRWEGTNSKGEKFGIVWELDEDGILDHSSVRYKCRKCGHLHHNDDKDKMFRERTEDYPEGARWVPTKKPSAPGVRSYHLPGMYSPPGMKSWAGQVDQFLAAYDPVEKRTLDIGKLQAFYNNVLAEPFEFRGARVKMEHVTPHKRPAYTMGSINNRYVIKTCGAPILMVTCHVDVHKSFLAVATLGWTKGGRCFLLDRWNFEDDSDDGCQDRASSTWDELREVIEKKQYISDDKRKYWISTTTVDARFATEQVCDFCAEYEEGVVPIMGRDRPQKASRIREFAEFETQIGTIGFMIVVDHYKDRLAPVLRKEWYEETGPQPPYHFNAPIDTEDYILKELTREVRMKKTDPNTGTETYFWHRPGNARNEMWDLLVYGHATVDITAKAICMDEEEMDRVDMIWFWDHLEKDQRYFKAA